MARKKKEKIPSWKKLKVPYRADDGSVPWKPPSVRPGTGEHFFSSRYDWNTRSTTPETGVVFKPNIPFKAPLKFVEMFHGANNNTHAFFEYSGTGATYVMREEHLAECLQKGVLIHGVILGEWRFMRRGGRWSIVPMDFISTIDLPESHE